MPALLFLMLLQTSSDVKTQLDAIDLDVGQYVDVGTRLEMRLFAGLRFAEVRSDQTINSAYEIPGVNAVAIGAVADREELNSKFTGVGPRVGIDSVYHIGNCFGIVGHASMSLLVGQTQNNGNRNIDMAPLPDNEDLPNRSLHSDTNVDDSTRVVPALDAKLGLNYSHEFDNESVLTLEGGYQVTQYIDAVDRIDSGVDALEIVHEGVSGDGPLAIPANATRTTHSVGFHGPYLSLNWKV